MLYINAVNTFKRLIYESILYAAKKKQKKTKAKSEKKNKIKSKNVTKKLKQKKIYK